MIEQTRVRLDYVTIQNRILKLVLTLDLDFGIGLWTRTWTWIVTIPTNNDQLINL